MIQKRSMRLKLKAFGVVLSPVFRMCVSLALCLFYSMQVVTQMSIFDSTIASTSVDSSQLLVATEGKDLKSSFLTIDSLLLLTAAMQFLGGWYDYQLFERWVIQSDAVLFGLTVVLLLLSGTTTIFDKSFMSSLLYALNCTFGAFIALMDILDMRPMGADKKLNLLQQYRDAPNEIGNVNIEEPAGKEPSPQKKAIGKLRSARQALSGKTKYATIDDNSDFLDDDVNTSDITNMSKVPINTTNSNIDIKNNNNNCNSNADMNALDLESGLQEMDTLPKSLEESDISSGFRIKLDSLHKLAVQSGSHNNILEDCVFNQNRSQRPYDLPADVNWESLSFVEHRIDSSSCHIYTALWQHQPVIVKLIKADRISSAVSLSEFEAEAAVLGSISHPHVVKMLGSGVSPRRFIILELLDGGSMSHTLGLRPDALNRTRRQKFSYLEALTMARDLADALDYLHCHVHNAVQIIHRDIKPDNIGWTSDGKIKLFDFGLCSVVLSEDGLREHSISATEYLSYRKGYRMTCNTGTLRYMAPEVALNQHYHASVDTYSFSIVIWQVLSGFVPFADMGKRRYMEKVVKGGQRPPLPKKWPKKFRYLLAQCWDKDKNVRPKFSDIVKTLDGLIAEEKLLGGTGWRRVKNVANELLKGAKRILVEARPFFLLVFIVLAIGSSIAMTQSNENFGVFLGFFAGFGMYITLVSGLRYHLRGEGLVSRRSPGGGDGVEGMDADDILGMSVGLESGTFKKKISTGATGSAFTLTFNPLEPEAHEPLYGL